VKKKEAFLSNRPDAGNALTNFNKMGKDALIKNNMEVIL